MSARALYIGVDAHEKESQVAVYRKEGELIQEKRCLLQVLRGSSPVFMEGGEACWNGVRGFHLSGLFSTWLVCQTSRLNTFQRI